MRSLIPDDHIAIIMITVVGISKVLIEMIFPPEPILAYPRALFLRATIWYLRSAREVSLYMSIKVVPPCRTERAFGMEAEI